MCELGIKVLWLRVEWSYDLFSTLFEDGVLRRGLVYCEKLAGRLVRV
jgi:hypothetical protein